MADLGAETWIIHGTLLGWWWNRRVCVLPSDYRRYRKLTEMLPDHAVGFGY